MIDPIRLTTASARVTLADEMVTCDEVAGKEVNVQSFLLDGRPIGFVRYVDRPEGYCWLVGAWFISEIGESFSHRGSYDSLEAALNRVMAVAYEWKASALDRY